MAINAGDSRIGAEGLSCNACNQTSTRPNTVAHAHLEYMTLWTAAGMPCPDG